MAIDYDAWAKTYDTTRGASPSVLRPLLEALGPAAGRSLLDIGGGTGNFARPLADTGFQVSVVDHSPEMIRRAAAKLPSTPVLAVCDAQHLPLRDHTFDCAVSVNVLGHLPNWRGALREMRRILREGPLVIKASTRETVTANWITHYFPDYIDHAPLHHYRPAKETVDALREAGFSTIELRPIHYTDTVDGSFQALKHNPEMFFNDGLLLNTAAIMRIPEPSRGEGIGRIRADHTSGRLRDVMAEFEPLVATYGDGYLFTARPNLPDN